MAAGAGGGPHVKVYDGTDKTLQSFFAFPADANGMESGVRVGCGDVDGDGRDDLVTAVGPGDAPLVVDRDATTLTELSRSGAYDPAFLGGVNVVGPG
jgi:hypothetical protein